MCTIFTFKKNIYINCSTFFVPDSCGKFSSPYLGKAQQPQEQRHHFYRCWCRNVVPAHAHRCWCMQLHMGDVRTPCVREPALGEKSPASLGLKPVSVLRLAFLVRCLASWAIVLACLNVKTNLQFQFILLFLFSELTVFLFLFPSQLPQTGEGDGGKLHLTFFELSGTPSGVPQGMKSSSRVRLQVTSRDELKSTWRYRKKDEAEIVLINILFSGHLIMTPKCS